MKTTRSYTMTARAEAVERTRQRILDAMFTLGNKRLFIDITLDDVAREAGVSVQTILRQFGSRAALIEADIEYAIGQVAAERQVPVGDVDAAVRVICDHYETRGDIALMMLAQEHTDPQVERLTENGRKMHRTWVGDVFAPYVATDEVLIDLLVVATDVYSWKLLRRDRGLSRPQTELRIRQLVASVLAGIEKGRRP